MSLPNVNITLGNGNIGTVTLSDDGISGLILSGKAVDDTLSLDKVYILAGTADLKKYGITKENNPLLFKDIMAFYTAAGDGAELHLLVVDENKKLTDICSMEASSPLKKLIDSAAGRIRLVGINVNPGADYNPTVEKCIDQDVVTTVKAAQNVASNYLDKIAPFVVLLPALAWNGSTDSLYQPREGSENCVSVVLASDGKVGEGKYYSAAIGQVLGRLATCPVNISLARVRDGSIAAEGWLTEAQAEEACRTLGYEPKAIRKLKPSKHIFSHVEWHMHAFEIEAEERPDASAAENGFFAAEKSALQEEYSIPTAFKAYMDF